MPAPKAPHPSRTQNSLDGLRVLLLEDDPTDAIMAKESITALGATVDHVTTLAEIIDRLRAETPTLGVGTPCTSSLARSITTGASPTSTP